MKTLAFVLLAACAMDPMTDGSDTLEQETASTQYVSIFDFPKTDQGAYYDLEQKLNQEFVKTGGYSAITPLSFYCSVTSKLGTVHDCAWTFASSQVGVDGTTAAIGIDAPTYQCHVHPHMSSVKLIAALTDADDAIHTTLPGMGTIADSFTDCFNNPIGSTPITVGGGTTYVEAGSYYSTPANQKKWLDAKADLKLGFDNVCGDTFCGSDFNDLQSLTFACAITKSSGNVKSCAWTFGGSFGEVATNGAVAPTSKTFTCNVNMHGTLGQLITTLTGAGAGAINAPLPGLQTSTYDALTCLP